MTYTVKAGDTLYGISNQFGVSVTELAQINNAVGRPLRVGEVLTIPMSSGTNPNNMFMYTVKKGDSLYSIAKKYNTTVDEIMKLNYLTSTNLSIGQVIRIPEMYFKEDEMYLPNYINYTVKRGDSLYSIARDNNIDINTLIKDNSLTNTILTIGQVLRIRTPMSSTIEVEECIGPDYTPPISIQTNYQNYTVARGDSLYSIARKFNTTVDAIVNLNNLKNNNLSIGQTLKIPITSGASTSTNRTYTVKAGDNLYSIARTYNTTVDEIKRKNNLTTNLLSVGQKLII